MKALTIGLIVVAGVLFGGCGGGSEYEPNDDAYEIAKAQLVNSACGEVGLDWAKTITGWSEVKTVANCMDGTQVVVMPAQVTARAVKNHYELTRR